MARPLLLDTDVLVEYLRNHPKAVAYLESQAGPLLISAIPVAELYGGVRGSHERERLEIFLDAFEVLLVDRSPLPYMWPPTMSRFSAASGSWNRQVTNIL